MEAINIDEKVLDLEDLQKLLNQAEREISKKLIQKEISKIREEIKREETLKALKQQSPQKIDQAGLKPLINFKQLNYGWTQTQTEVKIYITSGVDGIGNHPQEKIEFTPYERSIDFKLMNWKGGNYRCRIGPLYEKIQTDKAKMNVKTNSVSITLVKVKKEMWGDIKPKGNQFDVYDEEGKKDPNQSILAMMKDVYQTGDPEIKKGMEEAFKSQQRREARGDLFDQD